MSDPQVDPITELAVEMGFNPDYDGENKKTAAEFIKHGAKIQRSQSEKIKDLIDQSAEMRSDFVKMQETFDKSLTAQQEQARKNLELQRAELEAKRYQAVDEADTEEFKRIDKQIRDIDKQASDIKPSEKVPKEQEIFNDWWSDKKAWLKQGSAAEKEMMKAITNFRIDNGGNATKVLDVNKELAAAEEHLKKLYPENFGLKPEEKPGGASVGEGKPKSTGTGEPKLKKSELTSDEKKQFETMKKYLGKHFDEAKTLTNFAYARKA